MSLSYPHTATITRPGDATGASLDDFGQPTSSIDPVAIYSGVMDFQDIGPRRLEILRNNTGDESLRDVMDGYFPDGVFPTTIKVDDDVSTTIRGQTFTGRVLAVDDMEESILVRWR